MPDNRRFGRFMRSWSSRGVLTVAVALVLVACVRADTVTLKDGTKVDGTIVRETDTFVQIKVMIGGIESVKTYLRSEITSIAKDAPPAKPGEPAPAGGSGVTPTPAKDKAPAKGKSAADKAEQRAKDIDTGANRMAILDFGPPSSWHGEVESTVGVEINANAWREAVKLLDKDKVNIVAVRVNSGGGALSEIARFHSVFENVYKRKYRTVAWIESAISAAAMSPYVIEEMYFMPNGSLGACTGWHGNLQNLEGLGLAQILNVMEDASKLAGRPPCIMRSMQIMDPLSATIDPKTGEVTWFQDTSGQTLLNPPGQIFTFTANDAVKFKFAKGIAATKEELAKVMGLNEVVWAGKEAAQFIDDNMRASDKTEKRWQVVYREFALYAGMAEQAQDRTDRGKFVGKAISALREMKSMFSVNPNFGMNYGITDAWFQEQEQALRKLLQR